MKKLLKTLPWLLAGAALYLVLFNGFDFVRGYFRAKAGAEAKAKYEETILKKDAEIAAAKTRYMKLSEIAGREREMLRLSAEAALRKAADDFARLKSRSAEELREKKATIAEVLAEKAKDELALVGAKVTIERLEATNRETIEAWRLSDEMKDQEHEKAILALDEKYRACDEWRKRIEKKLRPTFWKKVEQGAKYALAFGAGYAAGRIR